MLEDWLQDCDDSHDKCKPQVRPNRQLPTRLISLHEENGECFPRLVYTVEVASTHLEYTTLSHRWGLEQDEKPIQTTKETEKKHGEGVTLHYLPRTFRDAIRISLAIGVPYIWIDSLCIVQDDEEDWRREAARMGDIYEGSYLNIAAIDSPNCNGGCALYRRKPATHVRLQNGSQLAVRALAAHPADVFDSHLNTRGWIFQELVLPNRILYCGKNQFYWQCNTKVYSEDGFIDHNMALNLPGTRKLDRPRSLQTNSPNPWWAWIQDFSKRNFTQSPDQLPALIGVTRRYQETTGLTPVLGLWKETLLDDLAWHTGRMKAGLGSANPQRSNIPNMPTWSWMFTKDCEILNFMCTEAQNGGHSSGNYTSEDEDEDEDADADADISQSSESSQDETDSQKDSVSPSEENSTSEEQSGSHRWMGIESLEVEAALPSRPKIASEQKDLNKSEPSRRTTAEVLNVQVHWEKDPLNSDILSTKLILEGPLKKIQFQYDWFRRRLHEEGTEESHNSDTFVVRLDENQNFPETDLISVWCLQLWISIEEHGETPTFLVLDEIKNDGEVSSLRKFRRIGCGCLQWPTFDFEDAEMVAIELV